MGNVMRYTDLSWEIPGPRADVDLPLDDITHLDDITYLLARPAGPLGPTAPAGEPGDGKSGHGHGLEDFEQF